MAGLEPFRLADALGAGQNLAINQMKLGEAINAVNARQGLRQAVSAGTPEAMDQYRKDFPQEALEWDAKKLASAKSHLEKRLQEIDVIGRVASGVKDQASYDRARAELDGLGIGTSNAPAQYDPNWVSQMVNQSMTVKDRIEATYKQFDMLHKQRTAAETERANRAKEANAAEKNRIEKEKASNERDAKKRDVQSLIEAGVPANVARGQVYGTIKKVQDAMGLESRFIDIGTDQEVGRLTSKGEWVPGPGSATAAKAGGKPAAPAAGSVPAGVPAGYVQIGTSGGKPVYGDPKNPNAKRFVAD